MTHRRRCAATVRGGGMVPLPVLVAAGLLFVQVPGASGAAESESGPGVASAAAASGPLTTRALAERFGAGLAERETILAKHRLLAERLDAIEADLRALAAERQAHVVPETPDIAIQSNDPETVREQMDGLNAFVKALERRIALTESLATLAGRHGETALRMAQEVEALAAAWRAEAERGGGVIRAAKAESAGLETTLGAMRADLDTVHRRLAEAEKRAALRAEFAAPGRTDLVDVFNLRLADANMRYAAFKERMQLLSADQAALDAAAARALDTVRPKENWAVGEAAGTHRSRADLAAAEAAKAFQSERSRRIDRIVGDIVAQREALTAALAAAEGLLEDRIALEVLAEVLRDRPSPESEPPRAVVDGSLIHATGILRAQMEQLSEVRTALAAREAALGEARAIADRAVDEAGKAIEDLSRAVERGAR